MALYASWVHGNALTVEAPGNLVRLGHFAWGADMLVRSNTASWFHIPLPTPVIASDRRTTVQKLFLLFETETGGLIRNVHIYDGSSQVQLFERLEFHGQHRLALDGQNTFNLAQPHTVLWGMGISFYFITATGIESEAPPQRLIVAAAGADFLT
ncbi:MAG: hypothetical protein QOD80_1455 [Verrucomicrobiota bacterium]